MAVISEIMLLVVIQREICVTKSKDMETLQQIYHASYVETAQRESVISKFFSWCKNQEPYRYGWLAAIIALHGCVLSPITVLMIGLGGNDLVLWGMAIGAMGVSLITNLAALSTKITIPVFFVSILIDLVIVGICLGAIL